MRSFKARNTLSYALAILCPVAIVIVTRTMSEALKATKAREITKESVTEAETLVVNGVSVSQSKTQQMQAGDFYFRPTVVQTVIKTPWYRRLFSKDSTRLLLQQITTIVISCPVCGLPIPQEHALAHRTDEFPDGYSLAGCAPAEPAAASPSGAHLATKSFRCTMQFQPTVSSALTVCLTPGDNPKQEGERAA
jgi:hypothetical protein